MKRDNKGKQLEGEYCLPTSAKAHMHEQERCTAYKPGQILYLLRATNLAPPDGDGYPPQVVVSADKEIEGWIVDEPVRTQHAENPKNLPARHVEAIMYPDGQFDGPLPPKGLPLPHWEHIPTVDGGPDRRAIAAVRERMEANKKAIEQRKEEIRRLKKGKSAA